MVLRTKKYRNVSCVSVWRLARCSNGSSMLQQIERLDEAVRAHLVGVADAGAQVRVGAHDRAEHGVDRAHRRGRRPRRRIGSLRGVHRAERWRRHLAQGRVPVGEGVVALAPAPRDGVLLQALGRHPELVRRHPQPARARGEPPGGPRVGPWVGHQGQVVREVRARAREAEPLRRHRDPVGQPHRIAPPARLHLRGGGLEPALGLQDCPHERGRVAAVEHERVEPVQPEMLGEPRGAALLRHGGPLVDAAPVLDHVGRDQPTILRAPPAGRPVAPPLLLEGAVGQERHQALARQRHVHVLQLGESEIASLGEAARGVGVDVAAEGRVLPAVLREEVGVVVAHVARQAFVAHRVSRGVSGGHVADEQVHRVDGGHAVPLTHEPGPGGAGERVGREVGRVGRHHVERASGVSLGSRLEVARLQSPPVEVHGARIGLVDHQPQRGARHPVQRVQDVPRVTAVAAPPLGGQARHQVADASAGRRGVADHPVAASPAAESPAGGIVVRHGGHLTIARGVRARRSDLSISTATRIVEAIRAIRTQVPRSSGSTRSRNRVGGR